MLAEGAGVLSSVCQYRNASMMSAPSGTPWLTLGVAVLLGMVMVPVAMPCAPVPRRVTPAEA